MARYFNTTGPCEAANHYMLGPEERIPALLPFIQQKLYFVVHAARQTGKTTAMIAFAERLRGLGYAAVSASLEQSQGFEAVEEAEPLWLLSLARRAREQLPGLEIPEPLALNDWQTGDRLREWLARFCAAAAPRSAVVLLDETDIVSFEMASPSAASVSFRRPWA